MSPDQDSKPEEFNPDSWANGAIYEMFLDDVIAMVIRVKDAEHDAWFAFAQRIGDSEEKVEKDLGVYCPTFASARSSAINIAKIRMQGR